MTRTANQRVPHAWELSRTARGEHAITVSIDHWRLTRTLPVHVSEEDAEQIANETAVALWTLIATLSAQEYAA